MIKRKRTVKKDEDINTQTSLYNAIQNDKKLVDSNLLCLIKDFKKVLSYLKSVDKELTLELTIPQKITLIQKNNFNNSKRDELDKELNSVVSSNNKKTFFGKLNFGLKVLSHLGKSVGNEIHEFNVEQIIDTINASYHTKKEHNDLKKNCVNEFKNHGHSLDIESVDYKWLVNEMKKHKDLKKDHEYLELFETYTSKIELYKISWQKISNIINIELQSFLKDFISSFKEYAKEYSKTDLQSLVFAIESNLNSTMYNYKHIETTGDKLPYKDKLIENIENIDTQLNIIEEDIKYLSNNKTIIYLKNIKNLKDFYKRYKKIPIKLSSIDNEKIVKDKNRELIKKEKTLKSKSNHILQNNKKPKHLEKTLQNEKIQRNKISIEELPIVNDLIYEVIIEKVSTSILSFSFFDKNFLISMPQNNSWKDKVLKAGMKCQVVKQEAETSTYQLILVKVFGEEKNIKLDNGLSNIEIENDKYSKYIQSIENIKFERIRKYCDNLSKENKTDTMQEYLANNGKMYKALIYDSLEQFIENLNTKTISLIDWGCDQGIASMLVLDYIKEKQLDIKVNQILLIDSNNKKLNRARIQVKVLDFQNSKIETCNRNDNPNLDRLETIENTISLNLFANDKIPINLIDIDLRFLKKAYFICVSNADMKFVDKVYNDISNVTNVNDLSIRNGKIGRFKKFERIFFIKNIN